MHRCDHPAGKNTGRAVSRLVDRGHELAGRPRRGTYDKHEGTGRPLAETVLKNLLRPLGVGTGKREAVRQEATQPGRGRARHDEHNRPDRYDSPSITDHRARPAFHRSYLVTSACLVAPRLSPECGRRRAGSLGDRPRHTSLSGRRRKFIQGLPAPAGASLRCRRPR